MSKKYLQIQIIGEAINGHQRGNNLVIQSDGRIRAIY